MKSPKQTKLAGFTLIELLVVIVIIGILSTISTATFKSYFGKARDAERRAAVQNLALMIKVDSADRWDETKYIYNVQELKDLAAANDFRFPRGSKNICYFIGTATPTGAVIGDDNEFVVATWGETGHTAIGSYQDGQDEGLIIDGTENGVNALIGRGLNEDSFACGSKFDASVTTGPGGKFATQTAAPTATIGDVKSYFKINEEGQVEDGSTA